VESHGSLFAFYYGNAYSFALTIPISFHLHAYFLRVVILIVNVPSIFGLLQVASKLLMEISAFFSVMLARLFAENLLNSNSEFFVISNPASSCKLNSAAFRIPSSIFSVP